MTLLHYLDSSIRHDFFPPFRFHILKGVKLWRKQGLLVVVKDTAQKSDHWSVIDSSN